MRHFVVAFSLAVAACSDAAAPAPVGGRLPLVLDGRAGSDGAIVFTVSGGPVDSVTASSGYVVTSSTDDAGTHILIVGSMASGTLAQLHVPDVSHAAQYVVTVEQVADGTTFVLLDPEPFHVRVAGPR